MVSEAELLSFARSSIYEAIMRILAERDAACQEQLAKLNFTAEDALIKASAVQAEGRTYEDLQNNLLELLEEEVTENG